MTNKKATQRALLCSVFSMILCCVMLLGTTYAWFTDSASSGINKIVSGNLDLVLEASTDLQAWAEVNESTKLFDDNALYEPGYTQVAYLRVRNAGSLAFDYKLSTNVVNETAGVNINGEEFNLSDYLKAGVITLAGENPQPYASRDEARAAADANAVTLKTFATADTQLLPGETSNPMAIVIYMPEAVSNDANHNGINQPSIQLGINAVAKQSMKEEDSFGNTYDESATYPVVSAEEFTAAIDAITTSGTILLGNNITLIDKPIAIASGKNITIDTSNYTIKSIWTPASVSSAFNVAQNATLTLAGNGSVEAYAENPDVTWQYGYPAYANNAITNRGTLIIDGATVAVTTDKVGENGELGASYCIDTYAGSKLEVKSGAIINNNNIALRIFTSDASASADVTIDGGTIEGTRAIWLQLSGSTSSVAPKVNLKINGGNIKTNEAFTDPSKYCMALYSYSYGNSFANTNVTITGGNFLGYVAFGGGYKGDTETVTITGGTFTAYNTDGTADTDCVGRYTNTGTGWESIAH